jgi:hypothetical protein
MWAAVFAVLLALRLLNPAGFMPDFRAGAVTIVACPDADPAPSHHAPMHHGKKAPHQPCPYAFAASLGTADPAPPPVLGMLLLGAAPLIGHSAAAIAPRRQHHRPPSTGPPLPA